MFPAPIWRCMRQRCPAAPIHRRLGPLRPRVRLGDLGEHLVQLRPRGADGALLAAPVRHCMAAALSRRASIVAWAFWSSAPSLATLASPSFSSGRSAVDHGSLHALEVREEPVELLLDLVVQHLVEQKEHLAILLVRGC